MSVAAIQKELLNLPIAERVQLLDMLWDSLSKPQERQSEAAWVAESERRIDAFNDGKLEARGAAEVLNDLKKSMSW